VVALKERRRNGRRRSRKASIQKLIGLATLLTGADRFVGLDAMPPRPSPAPAGEFCLDLNAAGCADLDLVHSDRVLEALPERYASGAIVTITVLTHPTRGRISGNLGMRYDFGHAQITAIT
jgi:hypothetical protein